MISEVTNFGINLQKGIRKNNKKLFIYFGNTHRYLFGARFN